MEPVSTPGPVVPPQPSRGIFGTAIPSSLTSILAVLLFFLPFAEIRCKDKSSAGSAYAISNVGTVFSNTGIGLALGLNWKTPLANLGGDMGMDTGKGMNSNQQPNSYALVAWLLAIATAVLAVIRWKWGSFLAMVSSALSLAALIGLYIDMKKEVEKIPGGESSGGKDDFGLNRFTDVETELIFTPWFYATALLLLATVVVAYLRRIRSHV